MFFFCLNKEMPDYLLMLSGTTEIGERGREPGKAIVKDEAELPVFPTDPEYNDTCHVEHTVHLVLVF